MNGFLLRGQPVYEFRRAGCAEQAGKFLQMHEDLCRTTDIHQMLKDGAEFVPCHSEVQNLKVSKSTFWFRIRVTANEDGDWRLNVPNSSMNRIDLYILRKSQLISLAYSGLEVEDSLRTLTGGQILFPVPAAPGDTLDCYFRVENVGPISMSVMAGDLGAFFNRDHQLNLIHGGYYGIMFLMVLYNLFLFFTNRSRVYIYYILYIIFSVIFIGFFQGYVMQFPYWFRGLFLINPVLVPALFGLFGLLFTIEFLNTRVNAPRLHSAIVIFIWLVSIPVLMAAFGYKHQSMNLIQLFGVVLALLCLGAGIAALRRGYRPAKFYVAGFGAYMVGLLVLIVCSALTVTLAGLERYALQLGSAIEAVMLSFAIADKLNIANLEKTEAQGRVLEAVMENERLIREQNQMLEQKVHERTLELQEQKALVEEKNKDILDSIRYAKRIQESLLPTERSLQRLFKKLKG